MDTDEHRFLYDEIKPKSGVAVLCVFDFAVIRVLKCHYASANVLFIPN
jgi:hypothetical protein